MVILIDEPMWPAHGRLWAHLVSDTYLDELHDFARVHGIPARGFDRDHYDVPDHKHAELVAAGAEYVSGHELVRRLIASGLRVTARERRGASAPASASPTASASASPTASASASAGPTATTGETASVHRNSSL